jgi:hypothetical protein
MLPRSRYALVALVWLTAIATVIAGMPLASCLCPNGQTKSFCFGMQKEAGGCCCGGGCCATPPTMEPAEHSCCSQATLVPTDDPSRVDSRCCVQTVTQPDDRAAPETPVNVSKELTSLVGLVSQLEEHWSADPIKEVSVAIHLAAPPPDRVIVFQHLLI